MINICIIQIKFISKNILVDLTTETYNTHDKKENYEDYDKYKKN